MIILKRYFFDYIVALIASLGLWIGVGWFFDGIAVTLSAISFFVVLIGFIPYMIYSDYNKIKDYLSHCKKFKSGEISGTEFIEVNIKVISEETGLPDFIVGYLGKKFN
jgi:hypothetical protein